MDTGNVQRRSDTLGGISRRGLLKGVAAMAVASTAARRVPAWAKESSATILAYVGTYTPNG
jgi:hypothetical protein